MIVTSMVRRDVSCLFHAAEERGEERPVDRTRCSVPVLYAINGVDGDQFLGLCLDGSGCMRASGNGSAHRRKVLIINNIKGTWSSSCTIRVNRNKTKIVRTSWWMMTLFGRMRFRCFASVVFPEQVAPLHAECNE